MTNVKDVKVVAQTSAKAEKLIANKAKAAADKVAADKPADRSVNVITKDLKAIEAATAKLEKAKAAFDKAKNELRKLTGKAPKSTAPKGPGVISSIFELVKKAGKRGISKDDILKALEVRFPERVAGSMVKTINVQLPKRMSKEKGVTIVKLENGKFALEVEKAA